MCEEPSRNSGDRWSLQALCKLPQFCSVLVALSAVQSCADGDFDKLIPNAKLAVSYVSAMETFEQALSTRNRAVVCEHLSKMQRFCSRSTNTPSQVITGLLDRVEKLFSDFTDECQGLLTSPELPQTLAMLDTDDWNTAVLVANTQSKLDKNIFRRQNA